MATSRHDPEGESNGAPAMGAPTGPPTSATAGPDESRAALPGWLLEVPDAEALLGAEAVLPDPDVVLAVLQRVEEDGPEALCDVPVQTLLGVVASVRRSQARAQQLEADLAAALATHPSLRTPGGRPGDGAEAAAGELSILLGVSMLHARRLVTRGRRLNGWLWPVAAQARAGLLDAPRTAVFVEELETATPEGTLAVLDTVLPLAASHSVRGLRALVRRTLAAVDPEGESERAEQALATRHVRPVPPAPGGMAIFSALLPAASAALLENTCEAAAKAAKSAGDARTLDQLRADTLTAMAQQAALTGHIGTATAPPGHAGTERSGAKSGGDPQPRPISPRGPTRAGTDEVFRFDRAAARLRITATPAHQQGRHTTDPVTGITPAQTIHRDLTTDPALQDVGAGCGSSGSSGEATTPDPGDGPPLRPAFPAPPVPGVDVPELAGYGPLLPRQVHALLDRRWVAIAPPPGDETDAPPAPPPQPQYTPSRAMREHVIRRDQHCQAPGCHIPADRGDIHHLTPWPHGPTAPWNLRAVCRAHHNLLTHHGHTMTAHTHPILDSVTICWTTPTGTTCYTLPTGHTVNTTGYHTYLATLQPPALTPHDLAEPNWDELDAA